MASIEGQPPAAFPAAGEVARLGVGEERAAARERGEVRLHGGMLEHLDVHRGGVERPARAWRAGRS
jgi:hypothetical protein